MQNKLEHDIQVRRLTNFKKNSVDSEIESLWEQFRIENPNSVGTFIDQYQSFIWLISKLKEKNQLV